MIMAIALLFGCYDLSSLILIFFVNASMNFFGLLMEQMNPPNRESTVWAPFIFGCVAGIAPWVVVVQYFVGGGNFDNAFISPVPVWRAKGPPLARAPSPQAVETRVQM